MKKNVNVNAATVAEILAAHIAHIDVSAAGNINAGNAVKVVAEFIDTNKWLCRWGNRLEIVFYDGEIVYNNLREYAEDKIADRAAEYFISPLHNLEDVQVKCTRLGDNFCGQMLQFIQERKSWIDEEEQKILLSEDEDEISWSRNLIHGWEEDIERAESSLENYDEDGNLIE